MDSPPHEITKKTKNTCKSRMLTFYQSKDSTTKNFSSKILSDLARFTIFTTMGINITVDERGLVQQKIDGPSGFTVTSPVQYTGNVNFTSGTYEFSGDRLEVTGTISVTGGITGSLTALPDGSPFITGSGGIVVTVNPNGQFVISYVGP